MNDLSSVAVEIMRILGEEQSDKEEAFRLFYTQEGTAISDALCDAYMRAAVSENFCDEDDVVEMKATLLAGTELDIKFRGTSENVEACQYVDGETTWAGCEVLESVTEFTMNIPAGDRKSLAAVCACLKHRFWNSSAPMDFDEESLNDKGSEFLFLDQEGKRCSGQPEDGAIDPEYSGDGDSVYYARNFGSDLEYEPWDSIPDVVAGVHCLWILALVAQTQWADLSEYDVRGHEAELEQLKTKAFSYFS